MSLQEEITVQADVRRVGEFLRGLPYVQDASAWMSNGRLLAHVTVTDFTPVVSNTFKSACLHELGVHMTPSEIYLIVNRELVA